MTKSESNKNAKTQKGTVEAKGRRAEIEKDLAKVLRSPKLSQVQFGMRQNLNWISPLISMTND
jgi:hypothetical protein